MLVTKAREGEKLTPSSSLISLVLASVITNHTGPSLVIPVCEKMWLVQTFIKWECNGHGQRIHFKNASKRSERCEWYVLVRGRVHCTVRVFPLSCKGSNQEDKTPKPHLQNFTECNGTFVVSESFNSWFY